MSEQAAEKQVCVIIMAVAKETLPELQDQLETLRMVTLSTPFIVIGCFFVLFFFPFTPPNLATMATWLRWLSRSR